MHSFFRMLCLALFLSAFAAGAQNVERFKFNHAAPPPSGLLSFRAYDVKLVQQLLQDREGFIWAGTDAGLFRYEGHRFTAFGLKDGLPSSEILALQQDPEGVLWVGTRQGLARWNGRTLDAPMQGLPAMAIKGLASAGGVLWVGTDQGPFVQTAERRFARVERWTGGAVTSLWAGPRSSTLWVASSDAGKTHVQAHTASGWRSIAIPVGMNKASIDAMAEDGRGRLWARAPRSLWVLDPGATQFKRVIAPMPLISDRGHLLPGARGDIWIPTQDGLVHLEGDTWTALTAKDGLPTAWCRTALVDREGSLWVGSTALFRLLGRGAWRTYTQTHGLPNDIIWSIFRDRDGQLWVGTDNGLAQATPQGWKTVQGTSGYAIRSIVQSADGLLYLAGVPGTHVLRYNPASQSLQPIELSQEAISTRIIRIMLDKHGYLWAATDGAGLLRANTMAPTLRFERIALPGDVATETTMDVKQDAAGRIWATGEHGLAMLENGKWRRFTAKDGLKQDLTLFVRFTKNGEFLLSYNDPLGVTRARYDRGVLKILPHLDTSNGLEDNKVYLLGEDARSQLWVGSGSGLDLVMPQGIEHFGLNEGLPSEDVNNMAFMAEPNGDVWIGTSGGLLHFQAEAFPGISATPSTVFLSLKLGQQNHLPKTQTVRVPYEARTLEAHFASLNFVKEASILQQVRLLGLESEWRTTDTHEARYPALPHGHYRFEVRSKIKQGAWGPVAAFEFEVLPPWWHTWWFRALIGLVAMGLILLILRWRLHALRRQNRLLQEQITVHTKDLEISNLALKNLTLTDPLTSLRNRRFLSECMPGDVAQANRLSREASGSGKNRMALNIDLLFIMVDLDHFKHVNDEYGHPAGDKVLEQTAFILKEATRDTDTVVRWGGEEFLIVGRQVCRNDFTILAERIRANIEAWEFDLGAGKTMRLTCSLGLALYPFVPMLSAALPWERVVDLADQCLYAAKRSGRNAWVGICPSEGSDELAVSTRPGTIPTLIEQGVLSVQTSLPPGTYLDWVRPSGDG